MFEEKEGLIHRELLVWTMLSQSAIKSTPETTNEILDQWLEHCTEIYHDGKVCGFLLVLNTFGVRTLHGYSLIDGVSVRAYKLAKRMIDRFQIKYITTTMEQTRVIRLVKILGFRFMRQIDNCLCFERR